MNTTEEFDRITSDLVTLSRLALADRPQDVQLFIRRIARAHRQTFPEMSKRLLELLEALPSQPSPLRTNRATAVPVDAK